MKRKITTLRKVIANNIIDRGLFLKKTGKKLVVLMYHGIDQVQNTTFNERFYSLNNFEQQIAAFKKHFNILTYNDFLAGKFTSGKTNILLTFDDGYANNYKYALPVLEKYDVHAIFFITGVNTMPKKILWADAFDIVSHYAKDGQKVSLNDRTFALKEHIFFDAENNTTLEQYVRASNKSGDSEKQDLVDQLLEIYDFRSNRTLDDYWQLMTDEQILKASLSKNITIGSHGFYHNNLGSLSNKDAIDEALLSKRYLEGIAQKEVSCIGFPDGSYTEELNDSLSQAGFKKQFLVDYRYGDEGKRSYTCHRFGLYPGMGNTQRLVYKILHH
jgi:peptidoglycan/xylan/chitin deacetylase (PgdA/CDA1 family)